MNFLSDEVRAWIWLKADVDDRRRRFRRSETGRVSNTSCVPREFPESSCQDILLIYLFIFLTRARNACRLAGRQSIIFIVFLS